MNQLNIFEQALGTEPRMLARRDGTETSKAAAASINTTALETTVLACYIKAGRRGLTQEELCLMLPHLTYQSVTPRPSSLLRKGFIEDTGEVRLATSGRAQRVLKVTND